ncbi:LOW QUALITY PROTEIN: hypothetical protein T265_13289 [Opisthorchis viverrini]|uniref:Uncharacterized protein n=1 Tax=Opisthorchis viverrini TaxID=6198 RepID=A0A074ZVJ3_OPIVI|nr:LOW QUALITY PROTEIN: hypothetical protein T265_13289 [Opisthorchis viverrini]KER29907.1 LOW QUALITY PROTEIN: hypothetical protein T265_13289 [Opisthorchis viverrini]
MCCTRPPHVSLVAIFEISRYTCIRNALLTRLLKIRRQPATGFALFGAYQAQSPSFRQPCVLLEIQRYFFGPVVFMVPVLLGQWSLSNGLVHYASSSLTVPWFELGMRGKRVTATPPRLKKRTCSPSSDVIGCPDGSNDDPLTVLFVSIDWPICQEFLNIRLMEPWGLRLPDEPQEGPNRSWAVEGLSAIL